MSIFIHHGPVSLEIRTNTAIQHPPHPDELTHCIKKLKTAHGSEPFLIEVPDAASCIEKMAKMFNWIEAAGGIIENEAGQYLLIYRRGHWDLPKGKIDAGESPLQAAHREILEETGVSNLQWSADLPATYHIYPWNGEWVLKQTHWFQFQSKETQQLILQTEEEIEDARWMNPEQMRAVRQLIYPSLQALLDPFMG